MNLIEDRWIPVRRLGGRIERIPPWMVTDSFENDPVVALAEVRPDFKGGLMQFLIGLIQVAAAPDEQAGPEWEDLFEAPPAPDELRKAFAPYVDCFHLDGDGARFMQDRYIEEGKTVPIGGLLIDAPGDNTLKNNADHFVKRAGVQGLCYPCVATALFVLQTNAPGGGQGHRTSLRGGGPLTTLVALDPQGSCMHRDTLFYNIWLNIQDFERPEVQSQNQWAHIFPWMGATRTSEPKTGRPTYPADVHPLQAYWGMPRRIRLNMDPKEKGLCDLCGTRTSSLVRSHITRPYGFNYEGAWQHPLSPYWIKPDGEPAPLHPQPGGVTYRYWSGLIEDTEGSANVRKSARVVGAFKRRRQREEQFRLWVFGYDMDNMKPRSWYETVFPLFLFNDVERSKLFAVRVQELIEASDMTAQMVRGGVKEAWFKRPGDVRGDTLFIVETFFHRTESTFFDALSGLFTTLDKEGEGRDTLVDWHSLLCRVALELFDELADREDAAFTDMKRIVGARQKLRRQLNGKKLREVLHLTDRRKEKAA